MFEGNLNMFIDKLKTKNDIKSNDIKPEDLEKMLKHYEEYTKYKKD